MTSAPPPGGTPEAAGVVDDQAVPDLPLDRPRPERPRPERPRPERRASTAGSVGLTVDSGVLSRLALFGQECDAPLRAVLLAVYAVLLRSYGGDRRVVVELAPATSAETVRHTLELVIADDTTARDAVTLVRDGLRAAAPDGQAVRPGPPVFSWLTEGDEAQSGDGPGAPPEMRGDLWLDLVGRPQAVAGVLRYAPDVLDAASARRIADRYLLLAGEVATDPDRPVSTLPLMTSAERALFEALNSTAAEPLGGAFHEVFEAQAQRTPAEVAAHSLSGSLTYRELDRRANQLAWLLHGLGVQPGNTVGVCMDNGLETVVAVLGVLKTGAAYVPVDPTDPLGRRTTILQDAGVRMVLATPRSRNGLQAEHLVVEIDARWTALAGQPGHNRPPVADAPARAAYILYTSGTTGRPKGVVVENRQLMSYVSAVVQRLDLRGTSRSAMVQPLTVDSCVTALVPPLCTGGAVHLVPRNTGLDADRLADWFQRWPIDCLKIAPSHLRALQASPRFTELLPRRLLIVGGEPSHGRWLADLQRLAPGCRVVNHYGPTETTVGVLTFDIAAHPASAEEITPIGFPLPNTQAYIVDGDGQECPIGVAGELVIGGDTVARGYHGADQRAAAAFESDPLTGDRRYRTGDIARRLADGAIMFLGRRDDQIKVRGRRVQIGEIDAVLARHPAVQQAVTVVHAAGAGERALIAYVEPRAGAVTTVQEIRAYLGERLPAYMVPQTFTLIDSLPLSPHGKVDRSALPRPEPTGSAAAVPEFHGEMEQVVAAIWRDLLGLDTLGPEQNFFDVGGHSLLLVDLQHRLVEAAGKKVDLLELLHHPSVRAQASMLSDAPRRAAAAPSYGGSRVAGALQRRREQQLRAKRGRRD